MLPLSDPSTAAIYYPLNAKAQETRLLVLEAGMDKQPVCCKVYVAPLLSDPKPQYETVSYVWGDARSRSTIVVNGSRKNVPANCERVLRRMRLASASHVLWIDAVCIDQENLLERDEQVSMMNQIYSGTHRNLVWLGEDDGYTEHALLSMALILKALRQNTDGYALLEAYLFNRNSRTRKRAQAPSHLGVDEEALVRFFDSEWFSRLWTVQEVALAPCSICFRGKHDLPFEDVLRVCGWIHYQSDFLPMLRNAKSRGRLIELLTWAGPNRAFTSHIDRPPALGHLLNSMTGFTCSDPRDHVYGILGLHERFIGAIPSSIAPDYQASVAEVFLRATRSAMYQDGSLGILSQISHRKGEDLIDFPSWVPQLNRKWDSERDPSRLRILCDASRGTLMQIYDSNVIDKQLVLNGKILLGIVRRTVAAPNEGSDAGRFVQFLESVEHVAREYSPDGVLTKLAMVLSPGHTSQHMGILPELQRVEHFLAFKRLINEEQTLPDYDRDPTLLLHGRLAADYYLAFVNACCHRCFFATDAGYIGIGPQVMEEGDRVAILYGYRFPVVIRKLASHSESYVLIGEAYVYGIMDGEVTESDEFAGWEHDVIRLR
ncbi:hypothetical protein B0A48_18814 [Cryoendolithus antarcticus]|uniref:Heterokaryon incompatibility domain-containing protein n=1 Tax=Cryoendolithus antarcticus TaxID=1507870 RepID=A0A1V8S818_9PEZI|nr:hypothetical protein B0A48_18814 [Cryoendolithus antarcticus]